MDQLKSVAAVLKKYHFWILCGLAIVIGLTVWSLATAELASRSETRQKKIEGERKQMRDIVATNDHPNQPVVKAKVDQEAARKIEAHAAWKELYNKQEADNRLPEVLGKDFVDRFRSLSGPDDRLRRRHLEDYQNFISQYIPTLLKKLDVRQSKDRKGTGTGGGNLVGNGNGGPSEPEGSVIWKDAYQLIEKFDFTDRRLDTEQVVLAQEDLWVYEALVRVIKNTNGSITQRDLVPIRQIDKLLIGEKVLRSGRNPIEVAAVLPETTSTKQEEGAPVASRYVDDQGLPLAGPDYAHPNNEFKMMPIRIGVVIEQSKIPKLLVECANSKMPIEVRRWRLRPGKGSLVNLSTLAETGKSDIRQRPGSPDGGKDGGSDASYIPIEIEGIICIYNRPPEDAASAEPAGGDTPNPQTGQPTGVEP